MKRTVFGVLGSFLLAGSLVAAQQQTQPPPTQPPTQPQTQTQTQKPALPEVTLVGCVIQGSSPTVFILENAKMKPEDPNEKAVTYVLVAGAEDLTWQQHLNHEVRLVGTVERRTPPVTPTGQKVAEKDLLKFTAKSATMVADRCTP